MCNLQRNYDVIRNWERFETGPLTVLSNNTNPSLVLVQPRKTRSFITEKLLMGRKESN